MRLKEYFNSGVLRLIVTISAALVILILIFAAGVAAGKFKAKFRENRNSFAMAYGNRGFAFSKNYRSGREDVPPIKGYYGPFSGPEKTTYKSDQNACGCAFSNGQFDKYLLTDLKQAFSLTGKILKIQGTRITITDMDNSEKTVIVSDNTIYKNADKDISFNDLKEGDEITVIGVSDPNGQIKASTVRVKVLP